MYECGAVGGKRMALAPLPQGAGPAAPSDPVVGYDWGLQWNPLTLTPNPTPKPRVVLVDTELEKEVI